MKDDDNTRKVLDSLKSITEKYITYHFSNFLFDEGFLNFECIGNNDPDQIPEERLPAAKISMEKLNQVMDNYWVHYARFYMFFLYQCLDIDLKNDIAVMNYINKQAKQDIVNAIACLSATGKIYQTQYIQPEQVTLFTGSKDKIIAEHFADLDLIAIEKIDNKLFFEFIKKVS